MKIDIDRIFQNYNHDDTVKLIDELKKEIIEKENSVKEFLKKESVHVIDNTVKIKNVYESVEKVKSNLEVIISTYEELVEDIKKRNDGIIKKKKEKKRRHRKEEKEKKEETEEMENGDKEEIEKEEKEIIKNIWLMKYDRYKFLFENCNISNYVGSDFLKKSKEELTQYDFFYLNNYMNNVYFDMNRKIDEGDYIFVLNKIYTDIFICLKVLESIVKNQRIREIYKTTFKEKHFSYYLNSLVKKHKGNLEDILTKLIYASFYNLTLLSEENSGDGSRYKKNYRNGTNENLRKIHKEKLKRITASIIILLLFYNKKNSKIVELIKNDLFKEMVTARTILRNQVIGKMKELKDLSFEKLKSCFEKIVLLILNSKYILLILVSTSFEEDVEKKEDKQEGNEIRDNKQKEIEKEEDKQEGNEIRDNKQKEKEKQKDKQEGKEKNDLHIFIETEENRNEKNKNEELSNANNFFHMIEKTVFIFQPFCDEYKKKIEKNRTYFCYHINNISEIRNMLNKNKNENMDLINNIWKEDVKEMYSCMIDLLETFYKTKYVMRHDIFSEYKQIRLLFNNIKKWIFMKERYFGSFIEHVSFSDSWNNDYLNEALEKVFHFFLFSFFNKYITVFPFFDTHPLNTWKFVMKKLFFDFFSNVSTFFNKKWEIQKYIFYSFFLNVFYFYYEFCMWDIKSICQDFLRIANTDVCINEEPKKFIFVIDEKSSFHKETKQLIESKINPLLYVVYKLIIFVESKEMDVEYGLDLFCLNDETLEEHPLKMMKMLKMFINILKQNNETIKKETNNVDYDENYDANVQCSVELRKNVIGNMECYSECDTKYAPREQDLIKEQTSCNNIKNEIKTTKLKKIFSMKQEGYDFYQNLMKNHTKVLFNQFLNVHLSSTQLKGGEEIVEELKEINKEVKDEEDQKNEKEENKQFFVDSLNPKFEKEQNFCLEDVKCIFFHIIYKILKTSFNCFCVEYFKNLEKYLHSFLYILQDSNVSKVLCEDLNCHLINIFVFSSLFITYVEKVIQTQEYKSLFLFIMKTILQKKIYYIYRRVFNKVKNVYVSEIKKTHSNISLLNKKVTEVYNIFLLDICFCEYIMDRNTIVNKTMYEMLISKYKENKWYYLKSCMYFISIYSEKYNAYCNKKPFLKRDFNIRDLFFLIHNKRNMKKRYKEKENSNKYLLKSLTDDILVELTNLDELNNLIFQKHIRCIAQEQISKSYFLYFMFVEGSTLQNILSCDKEVSEKSLQIFNFNKVEMINNQCIENNLFRLLF